jgi:hypothetical protein
VPSGFTPAQIRHAYGFDSIWFKDANGQATIRGDGSGQTIAIIIDTPAHNFVAFSLHTFDQKFGLPDPQFSYDDLTGSTQADYGATKEACIDVEWAHAMAPGAAILLVEGKPFSDSPQGTNNLIEAIDDAAGSGASVVSMSFAPNGGLLDAGTEHTLDSHFNKGNVTFVAASGDDGQPEYPATSPNVVAVGGTTLTVDGNNNWTRETGWSGSGHGIDPSEQKPPYQKIPPLGWTQNRIVPDVAYNADGNSPYWMYDVMDDTGIVPGGSNSGWSALGGTSFGAPQWAALIAIADQGLASNGEPALNSTATLTELYKLSSSDFHLIDGNTGYQPLTGLGSPYADRIVGDLVYDDQPPQLTPLAASTVEGQSQFLALAKLTVSGSEPDAASVDTFTASISFGGTSIPGTFVDDGTGNLLIKGTLTFSQQGPYIVSVTVNPPQPNGGPGVFPPITVDTVVMVTDPPPAVSPHSFAASEGTNHQVVATFTSTDPDAIPANFHATIDWGDHTTPTAGIINLQSNGVYQVIGDHTYADELPGVQVTVTVSDTDGGSASGKETINVADAPIQVSFNTPGPKPIPIAINPTEGIPFHGVVAILGDANRAATKSDYSASINWGDNTPSTPATDIVPDPQLAGAFDIIGDHTYKEQLPNALLTVTVTDDGGQQDSGSLIIQVADAPLVADPIAVQSTEGQPYSGLVASFRDYDQFATPADFGALIVWGDGATTTATISYGTTVGKFFVSGSHDYGDREEGTATPVSVFIADVDGGQIITAHGQLQIIDAPLTAKRVAIHPVKGQLFQGVVGSFTDADPYGQLSDYSAKAGINWGDGSITDGTISTNGQGVFYVSGSHTYANAGLYQVKITVVDAGGASATVDDGFEPLATTVGLSKPQGLAAGDFNRDGKADLVVAQQVSSFGSHNIVNRVTVLLGNGDGTFRTGWSTDLTGSGFVSVATADLTGNGILDLVVSEQGSYNPTAGAYVGGGVMVFLGNGDGTFRAGPTYADSAGPVAVALGDLNGDGRPDLAVADVHSFNPVSRTFTGAIRLLAGNGDGTFRLWLTLTDNAAPIALAIGDVNGDHRADLVVADAGTSNSNAKVRVLLNQGSGTFLPGWSISLAPTGIAGPGHIAIALGDFHRDGKLDLAVAKQGAGTLTVYAGQGDGTFQEFVTRGNIPSPSALAAADFNGDGKLDLAIADFMPGTVTVWANTLTAVSP